MSKEVKISIKSRSLLVDAFSVHQSPSWIINIIVCDLDVAILSWSLWGVHTTPINCDPVLLLLIKLYVPVLSWPLWCVHSAPVDSNPILLLLVKLDIMVFSWSLWCVHSVPVNCRPVIHVQLVSSHA